MKYLSITILILIVSCAKKNESENLNKKVSTLKIETPIILTDKSVKFLWREDEYDKELKDTVNTIFINKEYAKNISEPEKAALGFVASFIGSECDWDGEPNEKRDNLSCKINTALNIGYQCSEEHLSFLRKWFKNDKKQLERLADCSAVPFTASSQVTFDYINVVTKGDTIKISFKAVGASMRTQKSSSYKEEDTFVLKKDNLVLLKSNESESE
ncbi:hypothetical protein [Flavobacterium tructae]|uniref:Lipoprotein n=1 Tax=Flavobacterium tructae TaxID=1114873 RepID=A0A1S1J1N2_9FLAO|nr:hypothetical protein [Flavobacterium tructae]OHT43409.1 hypothetical protein BHE19_19165 [Flavobacterium tructae]OXB19713.1 hypothetical protein B0A71_09690 [Flavobacterium tructae]OXB23864.1 hypothetical protein B0A80_09400 [Flavobacterium tructae]